MAETMKRITWTERADRRRRMAAAVTDAASMGRVAVRFGVTIETVRAACRAFAPEKLLSFVHPTIGKRRSKATAA